MAARKDSAAILGFIERLAAAGALAGGDPNTESLPVRLEVIEATKSARQMHLLSISNNEMIFIHSHLSSQLRSNGLPDRFADEYWSELRLIHNDLPPRAGDTYGRAKLDEIIENLPEVEAAVLNLIGKVRAAVS